MLHTLKLLQQKNKQLHKTNKLIKIFLLILIICNITLLIQLNNTKAINLNQQEQTPQKQDDIFTNLSSPPTELPTFEDVREQIINNESI